MISFVSHSIRCVSLPRAVSPHRFVSSVSSSRFFFASPYTSSTHCSSSPSSSSFSRPSLHSFSSVAVARRWFSSPAPHNRTQSEAAASSSSSLLFPDLSHVQSPSPSPIRNPPFSHTIRFPQPFPLIRGGSLPYLDVNYTQLGHHDRPAIFVVPSMSHSSFVVRSHPASSSDEGWWEDVVGYGDHFGIDLNHFQLISASPIGGPYASSSPLSVNPSTGRPFLGTFPVITPADQALAHLWLLCYLFRKHSSSSSSSSVPSISLHGMIGSSMGGMQVLSFLSRFPFVKIKYAVSICSTAHTSPSTVALRSVQRQCVMSDPSWHDGQYHHHDHPTPPPLHHPPSQQHQPTELSSSSLSTPTDAAASSSSSSSSSSSPPSVSFPKSGLQLARQIGTIAYRSRSEFDGRFNWHADPVTHEFEVERYLRYVSESFSTRYDAACYITLSRCMDLMDIGFGTQHGTYENGVKQMPTTGTEYMLLPIASDALIPAHEMSRLAEVMGQQGKRVQLEVLSSLYGHDAFLKEQATLNPRLHHFFYGGVQAIRHYLNEVA